MDRRSFLEIVGVLAASLGIAKWAPDDELLDELDFCDDIDAASVSIGDRLAVHVVAEVGVEPTTILQLEPCLLDSFSIYDMTYGCDGVSNDGIVRWLWGYQNSRIEGASVQPIGIDKDTDVGGLKVWCGRKSSAQKIGIMLHAEMLSSRACYRRWFAPGEEPIVRPGSFLGLNVSAQEPTKVQASILLKRIEKHGR